LVSKIGGLNCVKKMRKTWTFGFMQAVSVLCDFGPSLFGYTKSRSTLRKQYSKNQFNF
jgi:hypothetical protein